MYQIDITTESTNDRIFLVTVRDGAAQRYTYRVRVAAKTMDEFDLSIDDLPTVIEQAFVFLLDREPPKAILPSFELMTIAMYFPEFAPGTDM